MLPLFHMSLLEVATIWDPDGLPVAYPCDHRHYTGQKSHCCHTKEKKEPKEQTSLHAKCKRACPSCRWVNTLVLSKFSESNRHRRAETATLANATGCKEQHMSWTWVQVSKTDGGMVHKDTKRPSYSSVTRRIQNIWLNSGNSQQKNKESWTKTHGCDQKRRNVSWTDGCGHVKPPHSRTMWRTRNHGVLEIHRKGLWLFPPSCKKTFANGCDQ